MEPQPQYVSKAPSIGSEHTPKALGMVKRVPGDWMERFSSIVKKRGTKDDAIDWYQVLNFYNQGLEAEDAAKIYSGDISEVCITDAKKGARFVKALMKEIDDEDVARHGLYKPFKTRPEDSYLTHAVYVKNTNGRVVIVRFGGTHDAEVEKDEETLQNLEDRYEDDPKSKIITNRQYWNKRLWKKELEKLKRMGGSKDDVTPERKPVKRKASKKDDEKTADKEVPEDEEELDLDVEDDETDTEEETEDTKSSEEAPKKTDKSSKK